ncbi:MAG: xanthine phosphoribosyltransferase [Aerococcus sp.]|nr:xanthine phosphoribosyltransferase [Aerococcus sp.]
MLNLRDQILSDGKVFPNNVLKVDSFLNHQIRPDVIAAIVDEFYAHFKDAGVTKVLTVEASGIAPAIMTALKFNVPMLFAKKKEPSTMQDSTILSTTIHSYTKNEDNTIIVSQQYLDSSDRVLIVDDFLANGEASLGLVDLCHQAGAEVAGVAICIEKSFQDGRKRLEEAGVPVYSEARIASLANNTVTFHDGH